MTDTLQYTNLITSFNKKPKFEQLVQLLTSAIQANTDLLQSFPTLFDVDTAIGQQLDYIGQWVGISRNIKVPITGQFFEFDTIGKGFDQALWYDPYQSDGVTILDDNSYRIIIKARILFNYWDGTIPSAVNALNLALPNNKVFIEDGQDMTMNMVINGPINPVVQSLVTQGYLDFKPAGVGVTNYIFATTIFAWAEDDSPDAGGFDVGVFLP